MDDRLSVVAIVLLIACSAFFSASETAFTSFNRVRIRSLQEHGNKRAALVLKLNDNYDKLLSTILVGNNIVNIAMASIATVLFVRHWPASGASLATLVTTLLVLIFGEISPKTLARENADKLCLALAPLLRALIVVLTPINAVFSYLKKLLYKLFVHNAGQAITEEELLLIVNEAEHEGAINQDDSQLIHNVIEFNDLRADEILTPRVDIVAVEQTASRQEIIQAFVESGYSRLPVYTDSIDRIIGFIHQKDLYRLPQGAQQVIDDIIKPVLFIAPSMKIPVLLKMFQKNKTHMAVVTDEYGGCEGIVTLEDILEQLVGEIYDEHDEIIEEIVALGDGSYRIFCSTEPEKLFQAVGLPEDQTEAATVSGWITEKLGSIPEEGDSFVYAGVTVTVTRANARRAEECVVALLPQAPADDPPADAEMA